MIAFISVFGHILLAALLGGGSAGLLGMFVVGFRVPFLAVFSAHAAFAGAIIAINFGVSHRVGGFGGALTGALLLGLLTRRRTVDMNAAMGVLFSLTLGIAFLGIGLAEGPKSSMLGLMWGSLLFVNVGQVMIMAALAALFVGFIVLYSKEIKLLLFSRELAMLYIPEGLFLTVFLVLAAGIIAIDLEIVGGLLLYSLITNPAVAAARLSKSYTSTLVLSSLFGAVSALAGFLAAYYYDLPVGACIVLVSSLIIAVTFACTYSRN
jgi:manganese/iron transport system permease protein